MKSVQRAVVKVSDPPGLTPKWPCDQRQSFHPHRYGVRPRASDAPSDEILCA
jgi:hypothetical protein